MRAWIDRIESIRIGSRSYFRFHTSSIPPTPYFRFADPYRTSALSLPRRMLSKLSQFVAASGTRAHVHSHGVPTGAMRGGHAAPALGGLASSAGASPRPQVSRSTSLPAPIVERPVAARPGVWPMWVRRVTCFFTGDFCPPCAGRTASLEQDPAVQRDSGLRA
jgi:hypothetical protein